MRQEGTTAEAKLGLPEYRGHTFIEKTAFAALILFVAAAALGAFGSGPASRAAAASEDGKLQVHYERFLRRNAPAVLEIVAPTRKGAETVELTLNEDYLRRLQVTEIFPEPDQVSTHSTTRLRFTVDGDGDPIAVRIYFQPLDAGSAIGHLAVDGDSARERVRINQFVYP